MKDIVNLVACYKLPPKCVEYLNCEIACAPGSSVSSVADMARQTPLSNWGKWHYVCSDFPGLLSTWWTVELEQSALPGIDHLRFSSDCGNNCLGSTLAGPIRRGSRRIFTLPCTSCAHWNMYTLAYVCATMKCKTNQHTWPQGGRHQPSPLNACWTSLFWSR
jgi:hypothetical protein